MFLGLIGKIKLWNKMKIKKKKIKADAVEKKKRGEEEEWKRRGRKSAQKFLCFFFLLATSTHNTLEE